MIRPIPSNLFPLDFHKYNSLADFLHAHRRRSRAVSDFILTDIYGPSRTKLETTVGFPKTWHMSYK